MRWPSAKIAAVTYLLWGIVHVIGGAMLVLAALDGFDSFIRAQTGNEALVLATTSATLGPEAFTAASGVFAFHAFNLTWLGLLAAIVAVRLNWRNSVVGYWLNLSVVGFTDLGLLLFIVRPGVLPWASAWIGPALLIPAVIFSSLARPTGRC